MLKAYLNIFKIADLRKKILLTLGLLVIYRVGSYIPTPGVDGRALSAFFADIAAKQGSTIFGLMDLFSGGAVSNCTIFALGIMPYISSSIILQLMTVVIPHLERLAKEGGEEGRKKINQYTRYGTVVLSLIQSFFISLWLQNPNSFQGTIIVSTPGVPFILLVMITLTAGTAFIMWLGEQITERGIGNGISIIIMAGIISQLPIALGQLWTLFSFTDPARRQIPLGYGLVMIVLFVFVVMGTILLTQGQRKIPVQYAKRVVGRKVYGGQSQYIPLRINHGGVIPIIFASSILMFPSTIASFSSAPWLQSFAAAFMRQEGFYNVVYMLLIIFFAYFYTAITFNPIEIADNMKKYGGFVPGIRPGRPTAEFFDNIITKITLAGSVGLAFIAVLPNIISRSLNIPFKVASFMGGTGLLIIVGVMLDTMKQVEGQLMMHHYDGFMKKGRIKGRHY
ncbi:preprotein translocase subunit SecY [PVC group bacterium]|nr:preprotein translocase subunit SecY [PVC group bacterium]